MRGYAGLAQADSGCLHFIRDDEIDADIEALFESLTARHIHCVYVDPLAIPPVTNALINQIGSLLKLGHVPYGDNPFIQFLDDLITLSYKAEGIVIIIDNANELLKSDRDLVFDLIEAFLIQFHHWFEQRKPCHLCFQLLPSDLVLHALHVFEAQSVVSRQAACGK